MRGLPVNAHDTRVSKLAGDWSLMVKLAIGPCQTQSEVCGIAGRKAAEAKVIVSVLILFKVTF